MPSNNALKRTKRPRGATMAMEVAPRAHSRTGRFAAEPVFGGHEIGVVAGESPLEDETHE